MMNKLLTVNEVAEIINCSPATIYSWAESGKMPACKINGLIRFHPEEIKEFVTAKKSKKDSSKEKLQRLKKKVELGKIVKKNIAIVREENYNSPVKGKSDLSQASERRS